MPTASRSPEEEAGRRTSVGPGARASPWPEVVAAALATGMTGRPSADSGAPVATVAWRGPPGPRLPAGTPGGGGGPGGGAPAGGGGAGGGGGGGARGGRRGGAPGRGG